MIEVRDIVLGFSLFFSRMVRRLRSFIFSIVGLFGEEERSVDCVGRWESDCFFFFVLVFRKLRVKF